MPHSNTSSYSRKSPSQVRRRRRAERWGRDVSVRLRLPEEAERNGPVASHPTASGNRTTSVRDNTVIRNSPSLTSSEASPSKQSLNAITKSARSILRVSRRPHRGQRQITLPRPHHGFPPSASHSRLAASSVSF